MTSAFMVAGIIIGLIIVLILLFRWVASRRKIPNTIGFFHPYCSSHGGGERVLWHAVKAILDQYPQYTIYIYSDPKVDEKRILDSVALTFKIDLTSKRQTRNSTKRKDADKSSGCDHHNTSTGEKYYSDRIRFIKLNTCHYLDANRYKYLTLLAQNCAAFIVGAEASYHLVPSIFIESIGVSFTMPIFRFHGCKTATYIHYPMISEDMIRNVQTSIHPSFNNRSIFVDYPILRRVKLFYYNLIALCYGHIGKTANLVMVNSNWTKEHIERIWGVEATTIYPPCDVKIMQSMTLNRFKDDQKCINIISIAQFRPEKNHLMQLEAFKIFLDSTQAKNSKLTLYGGVRNEEDRQRVKYLEEKISCMGLRKNVTIEVNVSFNDLLEGLRRADVAIHTMQNEHFGIVLLECMAAGLIMIAHNSGGPRRDIIRDSKNGFLATSATTFANKLEHILRMSKEDRLAIRTEARNSANKYSDELFRERFINTMRSMLG